MTTKLTTGRTHFWHSTLPFSYRYNISVYSFIPLASEECADSLLFSGASSIPLFYIPFPSTLFHQLVFHPPSLHFAIYFFVYLSASLFPNSLYFCDKNKILWEFDHMTLIRQEQPNYRPFGGIFCSQGEKNPYRGTYEPIYSSLYETVSEMEVSIKFLKQRTKWSSMNLLKFTNLNKLNMKHMIKPSKNVHMVGHPRCVLINYIWLNQLSNTTNLWWIDVYYIVINYMFWRL